MVMSADLDAAPAAHPRSPRWSPAGGHAGRVGLAIALAPLVVAAVGLVVGAGDVLPAHDIAQLEMRTRDVGEHEVLLGPYSRDGWYHLGPALFYLMAIPYRLTGGSSVAFYLGALAVNAASIAGMVSIARRRGGRPLMAITLLASTVLVAGLGPDLVRNPWNPYITVLPYGLLIFLTEIGFIVAFGVLLDTFVVRSLIVPALVIDVGKRVWWPSRLAKAQEPEHEPARAHV